MYSDLNEREMNILNFIKKHIAEEGYPPSIREMCRALDIKSTSTTHAILNILEEKGYIKKTSLKTRAIEVLDHDSNLEFRPKKTIDIPIVGSVTAGQPILAVENIEDTFPIPVESVSHGTNFMLNVKGESMIEAGIMDKDMIIVQKQDSANDGDIVVAMIDDSATVKRYFKKEDHVVLQPENSSMEPIIAKDVRILGKVVGLYRKYN